MRGDRMSQSELSRRSKISLTTINSMVLNKTKQVSLATLDAICSVLEIAPGELLAQEADLPRRSKQARGGHRQGRGDART
jgi:DNA-binding Xre family transcriptional regulator